MNKFSLENLTDISLSTKKTEKKQISFINENSSNSLIYKSNSNDLYKPKNNLIYLNNNPSIESKKSCDNYINDKDIFNIKDNNKRNNNLNNKINLLRKKTKVSFIISKKTEKKPKFFTTKYMTKTDSFFSKKGHNKNKNNIFPKKNLFQTCKYFYIDNQIQNTNGGRWSYEEHIKFIESFVYYGKKWATIQKYIGTRSCRQVRSHAQKFFLRLKELKTDKYNFKKSNINSLLDVVNLIAKNNETNKNNKEYIIDALIALTKLNLESNGKKYFERKKDNLIMEIKKENPVNDNKSKIDDEKLNKINNTNKELKFNDLFSGIDLIEDEDIIPNKKSDSDLDERYVNNNNFLLELKGENIYNNSEKLIHGQNYKSDYKDIDNKINPNFIAKNNSFLISDCSSFCNIDGPFIEPMNNIFMKNIKSTFLKFMN